MNASDFFKNLLQVIKNDALKAALPPLAAFFTSVAGNPSAVNVAAQLAKLQVDLLVALPSIEKDLFTAIAAELEAQIAQIGK